MRPQPGSRTPGEAARFARGTDRAAWVRPCEPVPIRLRVRYAETDQMGVAYYANYLVWFEVGRAEWLRAAGTSYRAMEEDGLVMPVIEAHAEYRQPLRYDDEFEVRTRASVVSPVRLRFDYEVVAFHGDAHAVVARGHTVHASLDRNGRPCRLPEDLRRLIP